MSDPSANASDDVQKRTSDQSKRRTKPSLRRKLLFGLVTTLGFFALLELTLMVFQVELASEESDPFVGFSGQSRLFTESENPSGEPVLVTAENRLTWFNRQAFLRDKPSNAYRIFCLGGSTTYGRPYDDRTSFAGFLRAFLPEMDPSRQWEVINAGGISYASYRIEVLVRELVEYQPDLLVIYTGHNEFLEDQTYSSIIDTPEPVRRAIGLARWSRTFSLMQQLAQGNPEPQDGKTLPDEVDAILDRAVGPDAYHRDDPWHERVLSQFQATLERIVDIATDAEVEIVFVVPASNLRDCAPFKSEHRQGLTNEELQEFLAEVRAGEEALRGGDPEEALDRLDRALEIDSRYAGAHFLRGRALLEEGDAAAARGAFIRAREEDICPLRAFASIQQIVRDVAEERGIPLIDFASIVDRESEHGIPGEDWFLDHVHPTIGGNERVAREMADELVEMRIVRPQTSWTPDVFQRIAQQVRGQIDEREHATALRNLAKVLNWAGKVDEADRLALKAGGLLPDDAEAHQMTGFAKLRLNQIAEAKRCFEAALRIQPDNARALSGLGDVYARLGQSEAARDCFSRAIAIDPKSAPALFNLGNALRDLGQFEEAKAAYRQALSVAPDQPDTYKNLGLVLFAQGDLEGGVGCFEKALALDEHAPQRHADLGFVLIDAGEQDRAEAEFRAALALDPSFVTALFGLAFLSEQSGDLSRANELIQEALRIAPDDVNLHFVLAQYALQQGDTARAKEELDTILKLDPGHANAQQLRATIE
jgi:tetratricopeptide (TPR) repeat protein